MVARRWPVLFAAGIIGAVIASTAAAVITVQARDTTAAAPVLPTPVTVTVAAPTPAAPAPCQPRRRTAKRARQGWLLACNFRSLRSRRESLPEGMTVVDPAVRSNPEWAAGVQKAGSHLLRRQGTRSKVTCPGATPVLAEAVHYGVEGPTTRSALPTAQASIPSTATPHDIATQSSDADGCLMRPLSALAERI